MKGSFELPAIDLGGEDAPSLMDPPDRLLVY